MEVNGVIYKIENKVNGKVYIGQTIAGFKKRIGEHVSALRHNRHNNDYLQRAWNKHGEENFSYSILETCDVDSLDDAEVFWIDYYRTFSESYNLESGGNKNKRHSKYSRKKMSKVMRERVKTPEFRKMIMERARKYSGKNNNRARKVICITTNEVFDTLTEASKKTGVRVQDIHKVCVGERITTGIRTIGKPLQFAYYEEGKEYKLKEIPDNTKGNHPNARKIICINNGKVFDSIVSASEYFETPYDNIHQVLLGNNTATLIKGEWLQFAYYEEGKNYKLKKIDKSKIKSPKKVICLTTGEVFNSTREAADKMNVQQSKISLVCNGKRKYTGKLPDGTKLRWAFYDTPV